MIFAAVGFCPWIRMAVRNTRAPIQTVNTVQRITPNKPKNGSHMGMVTDEAMRITMMVGVKGGIRDMVVASGPVGSAIIGAIRNMGMMAGRMPGKVRDCASFGLEGYIRIGTRSRE